MFSYEVSVADRPSVGQIQQACPVTPVPPEGVQGKASKATCGRTRLGTRLDALRTSKLLRSVPRGDQAPTEDNSPNKYHAAHVGNAIHLTSLPRDLHSLERLGTHQWRQPRAH